MSAPKPEVHPILTKDGSPTLFAPQFNEHYHSLHGAVQESLHVFIEMGLKAVAPDTTPLNVFEMGFGTGLNALLTLHTSPDRTIHYTTVEAFPLASEQWQTLQFCSQLEDAHCQTHFEALHSTAWGEAESITPHFTLTKHSQPLQEFNPAHSMDLIYWDAFAPTAQPELWTEELFHQIYGWMNPGGVWVTYSAKGDVRRALQSVGFEVERLPGPPGKREMLRARKINGHVTA